MDNKLDIMKYLVVKIRSQTASYRDPDFQNFHKSLLLPPPTTIIGFFGAALGLSAKQAQEFFDNDAFEFGVYGKSAGIAKDLWKYIRYENKKYKSGILHKEILFDNILFLCVGCKNDSTLIKLQNAVLNPCYALTLGNSDSLAFVCYAIIVEEIESINKVSHCLMEGDIVEEVLSNADKGMNFSIYTTSDPISYNLPVMFDYKGDYDVRKVSKRKTFSFIGEEMLLNVRKKAIKIEDKHIPVFTLI